MIGKIVCSKSGHDKGALFVIVGWQGQRFFIANGKERKLSHPKKKNGKHLLDLGITINAEQFATDKMLRRTLAMQASRQP